MPETPAAARHIATLPFDVFLCSWDLLDPVSRLSLGLTNKEYLMNLRSRELLPGLDKSEKIRLLEGFERDDRNRSVCFHCRRLVYIRCRSPFTWNRTTNIISRCCMRVTRGTWEIITHPGYSRFGHLPDIDGTAFALLHAVMNRHHYGPRAGLPLRHLEREFHIEKHLPRLFDDSRQSHFPLWKHSHHNEQTSRRPFTRAQRRQIERCISSQGAAPKITADRVTELSAMDRWTFAHNYKARILDNELFLARTHQVSGPSGELIHLVYILLHVKLPICQHLAFGYTATVRAGMRRRNIITISPSTDPETQWMLCRDVQGSCENCLTDYEFDIQQHDNNGKLSIELTTYHLVGPCQNPDEPEWKAFGADEKEDFPRDLDSEDRGVLRIRRRWRGSGNQKL
jgi:hypothetical protein